MKRIGFSIALATFVLAGIVAGQATPADTAQKAMDRIASDFRDACAKADAAYEKKVAPSQKERATLVQAAAKNASQRLDKLLLDLGQGNSDLIKGMVEEQKAAIKEVAASQPVEPSGLSELVGTWKQVPYGGGRRTYVITADGKVQFSEEKRTCQIQAVGEYFLLDFGDGKLDRCHMKGGILYIEHYNPKSTFQKNDPACLALARKESK